jgi:nucleoside permease NupC
MNWTRALVGGLLAELLVLVLIAPVALGVGLDSLGDPASVPPLLGYSIVVASFIAPLIITQWVTKRVSREKVVLHGALVGFTAFAIYMIPMTLSGEAQPPIYWVAHAAKLLGGVTGGLVATRRRSARGTVAAT